VCTREEQLQITMNQEYNKSRGSPCCYQPRTEIAKYKQKTQKWHTRADGKWLSLCLNKMTHKAEKRGLMEIPDLIASTDWST
jgi:hypothetical protein